MTIHVSESKHWESVDFRVEPTAMDYFVYSLGNTDHEWTASAGRVEWEES